MFGDFEVRQDDHFLKKNPDDMTPDEKWIAFLTPKPRSQEEILKKRASRSKLLDPRAGDGKPESAEA